MPAGTHWKSHNCWIQVTYRSYRSTENQNRKSHKSATVHKYHSFNATDVRWVQNAPEVKRCNRWRSRWRNPWDESPSSVLKHLKSKQTEHTVVLVIHNTEHQHSTCLPIINQNMHIHAVCDDKWQDEQWNCKDSSKTYKSQLLTHIATIRKFQTENRH